MRGSRRISAYLLLISIVLLVSSWLFEIYGEEQRYFNAHPVMLALSKAITGLEKGLAGDDSAAVLSHAKTLKKIAGEGLLSIKPQKNEDMLQLFNEYGTKINSLSSEMVNLVKKKNLAKVSQLVEEVRRTCISCHMKFRTGNDEKGLFPLLGNVITGKVKILKLDGEKRTDRSNVVVFLDRVNNDAGVSLPRKNPVVSQKNRTFGPRVVPIVKGTTVDFPNDDIIFHNVFSLSKTQIFDLDIYSPGKSKSVTFPRSGWVKIYCNIHPKMVGHIIALDNPFFSLTDQKGIFVISGVPDGEYTLRTWHEFGNEVRKRIQVSGSSRYNYLLEIQEDKKFVQHKNKFGKRFKSKY
ncbi:MAG: hypothetical protein O7C75_18730 [Verrucomicrobia bacterium]|nr:hypothetical protein [Verrucomicrobiota bacterium]